MTKLNDYTYLYDEIFCLTQTENNSNENINLSDTTQPIFFTVQKDSLRKEIILQLLKIDSKKPSFRNFRIYDLGI